MKIELDITQSEMVELLKGDLFATIYTRQLFKTESIDNVESNLRSLMMDKFKNEKIAFIKHIRENSNNYTPFIKQWCEKNGIAFEMCQEMISLRTSKAFVDNFK